jgi:hypothetical protein
VASDRLVRSYTLVSSAAALVGAEPPHPNAIANGCRFANAIDLEPTAGLGRTRECDHHL